MSGTAQFLFFALMGYTAIAAVVDAYYTQVGMLLGFTEANPINKFLFSKIGQPLTAFLEIGGFLVLNSIFSVYSAAGSFVVAGAIAGTETFMAIRNYKLVAAAKAKAPVKK